MLYGTRWRLAYKQNYLNYIAWPWSQISWLDWWQRYKTLESHRFTSLGFCVSASESFGFNSRFSILETWDSRHTDREIKPSLALSLAPRLATSLASPWFRVSGSQYLWRLHLQFFSLISNHSYAQLLGNLICNALEGHKISASAYLCPLLLLWLSRWLAIIIIIIMVIVALGLVSCVHGLGG